MSFLKEITPIVLTFNEAANLGRTLEKLDWAEEVLIVDSFSDDETIAIARARPRTRIVQRRFDSFANQCNYGLDHVNTEWVLSMDADYVLSDELIREIAALNPSGSMGGYRIQFAYCVQGRPLRGSLYPARVALYRKKIARYRAEGHCQRVELQGGIDRLSGLILHDDRKPLDRWFSEQIKYATQEAEYLETSSPDALSRPDRIRKWIVVAPALVLFYTLFARGVILDGWRGWFYAIQRVLAELILSLKMLERRLARVSR
jgi:glycosyltransferase involved in cell wall biosynthesis